MDSIQMDDENHMNLITDADDMVTMGDVAENAAYMGHNRSMPEIVLHRSHSIDQVTPELCLKNAKVMEGKSR